MSEVTLSYPFEKMQGKTYAEPGIIIVNMFLYLKMV